MPIKIERIDYTNLSIPERLVLIQDILDSVVEALPEQHQQGVTVVPISTPRPRAEPETLDRRQTRRKA